jgi:cytoskeletal protein CcmA (bactofilin family)
LEVSGSLTVNGRLHVAGNLDVSGSLTIGPHGDLVVDGRRNVMGEIWGM